MFRRATFWDCHNKDTKPITDIFSHPWLGGLFTDPETQDILSAENQLRDMLSVEAAYTQALGHVGQVPMDVADQVARTIVKFDPNMDELQASTAEDGVVIPGLIRAIKSQIQPEYHIAVHRGMTSQDVIDTALVLSLARVISHFRARNSMLVTALETLDQTHGSNRLMGRTRMQAALEISVSDRLRTWSAPLADHLERLEQLEPRLLRLQLGGAVGDRAPWDQDADAISTHMAETLGLHAPNTSWHTNRNGIAEFAGWLSLVSGSIAKTGQDIALMAQQGLDEISLSGGGQSSAMPHKQNPVLAELLVTLGRFNATQLSGLHQSLIHEQERSGAAWSLEWMILPQMIQTTGRSLLACHQMIQQIERIGSR